MAFYEGSLVPNSGGRSLGNSLGEKAADAWAAAYDQRLLTPQSGWDLDGNYRVDTRPMDIPRNYGPLPGSLLLPSPDFASVERK